MLKSESFRLIYFKACLKNLNALEIDSCNSVAMRQIFNYLYSDKNIFLSKKLPKRAILLILDKIIEIIQIKPL